MRKEVLLTLILGLMLAILAPAPGLAQAEGEAAADPAAGEKKAGVPAAYASPEDTIRTFIDAFRTLDANPGAREPWEKIYQAIDVPESHESFRDDPARKLYLVLRALEEGADLTDIALLAPGRERVANDKPESFVLFPGENLDPFLLVLDSVPEERPADTQIALRKTDSGAWKFTTETLAKITALVEWLRPIFEEKGIEIAATSVADLIREQVPAGMKEFVLGVEVWQWLGIFVVIFLAVVIDFLSRLILRPITRRLVERFIAEPPEGGVRRAVRPLGFSIGALSFLLLLRFLGLPPITALTILQGAGNLVVTIGAVWAFWAITDLVSLALLRKAARTETTFDDMIIPLIRKSVKLFLIGIGLIYIADALTIDIGPLLASFGLAGLAVSFAAQDTIKNLFGGLTIFLDRPFKVGERVSFQGFDGIIEEIGFRSTRLRTLTGHLVTIPNGSITSSAVENIGRRLSIRRILNIGITYDTPRDKIEEGVNIIRGILEEDGIREPIHARIGGDDFPPRVYFNELNADSLNIIVIYWFHPPAYWDYLDHAQRFHLRLIEAFEQAGIEFAFPTQTLYLAGDPKRELSIRMLEKDLDGRSPTS